MAWEHGDMFSCRRDDVSFCRQRAKKAINQNFDKYVGGDSLAGVKGPVGPTGFVWYFKSFLPLELAKAKGFPSLIHSEGFSRYCEKVSCMELHIHAGVHMQC